MVLTKVEPDPDHPTGGNFCIKGKAAPELVNSPDRLLTPVKRTRPKGDPDAGWQAISWDEALSFTANRMKEAAKQFGPESVAFSVTTSSGTAISDAMPWIYRLINGFGSPNAVATAHICNWHKDFATAFTLAPIAACRISNAPGAWCCGDSTRPTAGWHKPRQLLKRRSAA
jgi:anaerobic selenocysteine-containing dehydrogenase